MKKPFVAILDEVRITRQGREAVIEFVEPGITTTRLRIGPGMSDLEVLDLFNDCIRAQEPGTGCRVALWLGCVWSGLGMVAMVSNYLMVHTREPGGLAGCLFAPSVLPALLLYRPDVQQTLVNSAEVIAWLSTWGIVVFYFIPGGLLLLLARLCRAKSVAATPLRLAKR
jgi:hypothetical protein